MTRSSRRSAEVHPLHQPQEIVNGSLAEKAGVPQIGWIPELVAMMVMLATVGMVAGALTVDAAVLIMAFSAAVMWVTFARLPKLETLRIESLDETLIGAAEPATVKARHAA